MRHYLELYMMLFFVLSIVGLAIFGIMAVIYETIVPFKIRQIIKQNIERYIDERKDEWIVSVPVKTYKFIVGALWAILFVLLASSALEGCSRSSRNDGVDMPICMTKVGCF